MFNTAPCERYIISMHSGITLTKRLEKHRENNYAKKRGNDNNRREKTRFAGCVFFQRLPSIYDENHEKCQCFSIRKKWVLESCQPYYLLREKTSTIETGATPFSPARGHTPGISDYPHAGGIAGLPTFRLMSYPFPDCPPYVVRTPHIHRVPPPG